LREQFGDAEADAAGATDDDGTAASQFLTQLSS